jgi:hypothetical protein
MHFDSIIKEIDSLSSEEKAELVEILLERFAPDADREQTEVGRRGLGAWTEATRDEDWAEFYPATLGRSGGTCE